MNKGFRAFLLVLLASGSFLLVPWQARTVSVSTAWSMPANLSLSGTTSQCAAIAVDVDGKVIVAWNEEGGATRVYYTSRARDGAWSSPADLSGNLGRAGRPALVSDAVGTLHVVWEEASARVTSTSDIMYAYRPRGGNGTAPVPATSDFGSSQLPALAVTTDGNVHLVWENFFDIRYAHRSPAGVWSAAANVSQSSGFSERACLAANGAGDVHLIWQDDRQSTFHPDVFYSIRPQSGGAWSVPLNLSNSGSARSPALALDGMRTLNAMWVAASGLAYASKPFGHDWSAPSTPFTGESGPPALAADSTGILHTVWRDSATRSILYAIRSPSGAWTMPQGISQGAVDSAYGPAIALDPEGYPHVVWDHAGEIYYTSALPASPTPTITAPGATATASPTSTRAGTPISTVTPGPSPTPNRHFLPLLLRPALPPTATPTHTPTSTATATRTLTLTPSSTANPYRVISGWAGTPPVENGILSPGEWDGAGRISGPWGTLSIKNDAEQIYFAFDWTGSTSVSFTKAWVFFDYPYDGQLTRTDPGYGWSPDRPDRVLCPSFYGNSSSCEWSTDRTCKSAGHTNDGHHIIEFSTAANAVGRSPLNAVGLKIDLSAKIGEIGGEWPVGSSACNAQGWGAMVFADAP